MFEAYKVGVRISLISNVATGLAAMSRQFVATGAQARALQMELNKIKALALTGGAVTGVGLFGLHAMLKMMEPASQYVHQLNIMNMAGLKHQEQVEAIQAAWANTKTIVTTTATENLRSLLDLRNILGNMDEAKMALPIVSRMQAVLASSSETKLSSRSQELAFSMAKALDIIGAARNKEEFQKQAEMMSKVIIGTQGRVTPEQFQSVFKYARQAKFSLNDEFLYQILPSLMLENASSGGGGGGSRGVGPMLAAFYRLTNQGYINKQAVPLLEKLGLIKAGSAMSTTTPDTMVDKLKGSDLAGSNPFQWVQSVLLPAIQRQYGGHATARQIQDTITAAFRGNQLAANLALEFAVKPQNFLRDQRLIQGTMSTADAYQAALTNDPNTGMKALAAQWENLKVSFMMGVLPVLLPALRNLAQAFAGIGQVLRDHPTMAKALAIGLTGLFAALGLVIGPMLLFSASMMALRLALPGIAGSLSMAGSALGVMGKASALIAAGAIGYATGTWINENIITPLVRKLSGDQEGTLGTGLFNWFHKDEFEKFRNTDRHHRDNGGAVVQAWHDYSAVPKSGKPQPVTVHTDVYLNGRKVGHAVTEHQIQEHGRRPQTGPTGIRFDSLPIPAGANLGPYG